MRVELTSRYERVRAGTGRLSRRAFWVSAFGQLAWYGAKGSSPSRASGSRSPGRPPGDRRDHAPAAEPDVKPSDGPGVCAIDRVERGPCRRVDRSRTRRDPVEHALAGLPSSSATATSASSAVDSRPRAHCGVGSSGNPKSLTAARVASSAATSPRLAGRATDRAPAVEDQVHLELVGVGEREHGEEAHAAGRCAGSAPPSPGHRRSSAGGLGRCRRGVAGCERGPGPSGASRQRTTSTATGRSACRAAMRVAAIGSDPRCPPRHDVELDDQQVVAASKPAARTPGSLRSSSSRSSRMRSLTGRPSLRRDASRPSGRARRMCRRRRGTWPCRTRTRERAP